MQRVTTVGVSPTTHQVTNTVVSTPMQRFGYMTKAIAHFERTGCILPGHAGEIAAYIAKRNHD